MAGWDYATIKMRFYAVGTTITHQGQEYGTGPAWVAEFLTRSPVVGIEAVCKSCGRDGWELVSAPMTQVGDSTGGVAEPKEITLIFKRPLE